MTLERAIENLPDVLFSNPPGITADIAAAEGVFDDGIEVLVGHAGIAHRSRDADICLQVPNGFDGGERGFALALAGKSRSEFAGHYRQLRFTADSVEV